MRYSASEKQEIITLVEQSSLPVRRTLAQLGISKSTFYLWYERYLAGGHRGSRRPQAVTAPNLEQDSRDDRACDHRPGSGAA